MATPRKLLHFNTLARKPFRLPVGQKQVWLPNFTITLLRTSHLPPQFASFIVPLSMNKLDLKDYLWHAYGIPVLAVRSYIEQRPVQPYKLMKSGAMLRRWTRPQSIKRMTVEMGTREEGAGGKGGGIFVWPDMLSEEEMEPWDRKTHDAADETSEELNRVQFGFLAKRTEKPGRETIAEQARRLREGKEEWKSTWQELKEKS